MQLKIKLNLMKKNTLYLNQMETKKNILNYD